MERESLPDTNARIKKPELFIGFVAPIGTDIRASINSFSEYFASEGYNVVEIKVTDVFDRLAKNLKPKKKLVTTTEARRLQTYPKSLAGHLHSDSVVIEGADRGKYSKFPGVGFEHFDGVSPRRYRELFERISRKNKDTGDFVEWIDGKKQPIIDLKFPFYMILKTAILRSTTAYLKKIGMTVSALEARSDSNGASAPPQRGRSRPKPKITKRS
ncbi:hypothetical protein [Bradyrhizobium sp. USDA 4452]